MFGKIKEWFGIEGAKMKLQTLEVYPKDVTTINGEIIFTSIRRQKITFIRLRLIEKYIRGRGDSKKIDEYELGKWTYDQHFEVSKDNPNTIFFQMPFQLLQSTMDKREEKGFFGGGFVAAIAKSMKGVYSEYRVEAEAIVEETSYTISDKREIHFQ